MEKTPNGKNAEQDKTLKNKKRRLEKMSNVKKAEQDKTSNGKNADWDTKSRMENTSNISKFLNNCEMLYYKETMDCWAVCESLNL